MFTLAGMRSPYGGVSKATAKPMMISGLNEGIFFVYIGIQLFTLMGLFGWDSYTVLWVARMSAVLLACLALISWFAGAGKGFRIGSVVQMSSGLMLWFGSGLI